MKFIELCAGIGGFSLGLEMAGMTCVGQVEIMSKDEKIGILIAVSVTAFIILPVAYVIGHNQNTITSIDYAGSLVSVDVVPSNNSDGFMMFNTGSVGLALPIGGGPNKSVVTTDTQKILVRGFFRAPTGQELEIYTIKDGTSYLCVRGTQQTRTAIRTREECSVVSQ